MWKSSQLLGKYVEWSTGIGKPGNTCAGELAAVIWLKNCWKTALKPTPINQLCSSRLLQLGRLEDSSFMSVHTVQKWWLVDGRWISTWGRILERNPTNVPCVTGPLRKKGIWLSMLKLINYSELYISIIMIDHHDWSSWLIRLMSCLWNNK